MAIVKYMQFEQIGQTSNNIHRQMGTWTCGYFFQYNYTGAKV